MTDFTAAERIHALQNSGLINPDLTLTNIVDAAQKIPGLGEGGPAAWELIGKDFVLRGLPQDLTREDLHIAEPLSTEQVNLLRESNMLNFDMTLGDLLEASAQISGDISPAAWELIGKDFVLRGLPDLEQVSREIVR